MGREPIDDSPYNTSSCSSRGCFIESSAPMDKKTIDPALGCYSGNDGNSNTFQSLSLRYMEQFVHVSQLYLLKKKKKKKKYHAVLPLFDYGKGDLLCKNRILLFAEESFVLQYKPNPDLFSCDFTS